MTLGRGPFARKVEKAPFSETIQRGPTWRTDEPIQRKGYSMTAILRGGGPITFCFGPFDSPLFHRSTFLCFCEPCPLNSFFFVLSFFPKGRLSSTPLWLPNFCSRRPLSCPTILRIYSERRVCAAHLLVDSFMQLCVSSQRRDYALTFFLKLRYVTSRARDWS